MNQPQCRCAQRSLSRVVRDKIFFSWRRRNFVAAPHSLLVPPRHAPPYSAGSSTRGRLANRLGEWTCQAAYGAAKSRFRFCDTRFRASERRSDLYLDPKCKGIVGGVAKNVLEIPDHFAAPTDKVSSQDGNPHGINNMFKEISGKWLSVIATNFRAGQHVAQRPKDFLPIIEHLESIHKAGYVHGDFRACNAAFPKEEGDQGHLIDFDFSGIAGEVTYPVGYVAELADGDRKGSGKEKIEKWHDWYALGRLIFDVHEFVPPTGGHSTSDYFTHKEYWMRVKTHPPAEQILELKNLLSKVDDEG